MAGLPAGSRFGNQRGLAVVGRTDRVLALESFRFVRANGSLNACAFGRWCSIARSRRPSSRSRKRFASDARQRGHRGLATRRRIIGVSELEATRESPWMWSGCRCTQRTAPVPVAGVECADGGRSLPA